MKIGEVSTSAIQGPRSEMQDVFAVAQATDGTQYFGVF